MPAGDDRSGPIDLSPESRGLAPGRGRMAGRRILVVGAGQTDVGIPDQPVGNGRAIAVLLGREGAHVAAADRDQAAAEGTVELIRREGGGATLVVTDVAEPVSVKHMVARSLEALGGLDGVVYNVGIPGAKGWEATTPESWDATMDANLRGAMLTMRAALPVLEPMSSVVFISAIAALRPTGQRLAYEASKAALAAVMRATATEGKERAIRAERGHARPHRHRPRSQRQPKRQPGKHSNPAQSTRHSMGSRLRRPIPPLPRVRLRHRADDRRRRRADDAVTIRLRATRAGGGSRSHTRDMPTVLP